MTKEQIKKEVLKIKDWEFWAERPFGAFIMSAFRYGQTREYLRRIGVDAEWPILLYQKGAFYKSEIIWDNFAGQLEKYLKNGGSVFKISKSCEQYGSRGKKQIKKLLQSKKPTLEKFRDLHDILAMDIPYVWVTHGLEHVYKKRLYKEAAKHIKNDLDQFIGDATYPVKKNQHHYFEQALGSNEDLKAVQKRFGWVKIRDGFSDPYTITELAQERQRLKNAEHKKFKRIKVPKQLLELVKVGQELVYLRTLRTDILYELLFLSRPIIKAVADYYKIPFKTLRDYSIQDLMDDRPKRYAKMVTAISVGRHFALFDKPILNDEVKAAREVRGMIANKGVVRGVARIVKTAYEIGKVKNGDIIFAPTTAPSYIVGMRKAAAFVTDEGGITSHAAIVSREMHKPCIIGIKIGTKIFKDGDLVEVDANKGIVRKI